MKYVLLTTLLLFSQFNFAETSTTNEEITEENKVIVQALDKNVDLSSFSDNKYKKVYGVKPPEYKSDLPLVKVRDDILTEAGLKSEIQKMDDLDRDMLYRYTKRLSLPDLQKKYPNIESEKLSKLKTLIEKKS